MTTISFGTELFDGISAGRWNRDRFLKRRVDEIGYTTLITMMTINAGIILAWIEHPIPSIARWWRNEKNQKNRKKIKAVHICFDWKFYILKCEVNEQMCCVVFSSTGMLEDRWNLNNYAPAHVCCACVLWVLLFVQQKKLNEYRRKKPHHHLLTFKTYFIFL